MWQLIGSAPSAVEAQSGKIVAHLVNHGPLYHFGLDDVVVIKDDFNVVAECLGHGYWRATCGYLRANRCEAEFP